MTQDGANARKPMGSSLLKLSQDDSGASEEGFRVGKCVKRTTSALTAPMGRLM